MPRPDLNTRKGGSSGKKSLNPFANWLAGRKERRMQAEESASRMITNKIAENESVIIDKLSSIDFAHSRLPKAMLEGKSDPRQSCGDLEYAANYIVHLLLKNPQTIKMDIRQIDQKLLTLVLLYKQAIEQGDIRAAYAAKGALVRGINDIRCRIPQNQPELAKQFVEANTKYLDQWITLVSLAQVADRTKQNVDNLKAQQVKAEEKAKADNEELRQKLLSDNEFALAFDYISEHDSQSERSKWTDLQREIHRMMIDRRMDGVNLDLKKMLLNQNEIDLSAKEAQVEILYTKVMTLPIVCDPNLMNKFNEQIEEIFKELAASDAEVDEILKSMDDIEGRIQQLDNTPGAIRAREVAAEEAMKAVEELKRQQEIKSGENALKAGELRDRLGIKSEEELAELRRQAEEILQAQAAEVREQLEVDQSDGEYIPN